MIDWARVKELCGEIGAEDFAEVVTLFLEEADDVVAGLPDCAEPAALEAALHCLKGAALNLGFRDLAQLCQVGEKQAAAGDTDIDLAAVVAIYDASKHAFEAGIDSYAGLRA